jgi:hypothetical protein
MPILTYTSGPVGGYGGDQAQGSPVIAQIPADAVVTAITLWTDDYLEQFIISYSSPSKGNGQVKLQSSNTGTQQPTINLQPNERVSSIFGTFHELVYTIGIETNFNTYGPWGSSQGDRNYRIDIPGNCLFAGVYGFTGDHIDSMGIYFTGPSGS